MKRSEARRLLHELDGNSVSQLGPFPASAVRALADLGLSDREIARYCATQPMEIAKIRLFVTPECKIAWYPTDPPPAEGKARSVPDRWPSGRRL